MRKLLLSLVLLTGCGTPGYIKAEAIEGTVMGLIQRHDAYVDKDDKLDDLEKRIFKRDGELLKKLFKDAKEPKKKKEKKED